METHSRAFKADTNPGIIAELCRLILEAGNFRFGNLGFTLIKIQKKIKLPKVRLRFLICNFNTSRKYSKRLPVGTVIFCQKTYSSDSCICFLYIILVSKY
jgi:hypothetical protein